MKGMQRTAFLLLAMILAVQLPVRAAQEDGGADGPIAPAVVYIDTEENVSVGEILADEVPAWALGESSVAASASAMEIGGKSALLMDAGTGAVLYEKNPHERLPIASVNKIMTLLLVMEAIDDGFVGYEDKLTCSATAASMGGSQIWLEEGEVMTVHELLKAAAIVSANDACAMLAEYLSGSIESFVARMNERAAELGMKNTKFLDSSGLNDAAYSTAYDVALMSRELLGHPKIIEYTTIWMDTLRDGASGLVNTNRLVRHYDGATGLKTGTTAAAGHCLSASATRDGLSLISVILGCDTTNERFGGARKMLDYGFATYATYIPVLDESKMAPVKVLHGTEPAVMPAADTPVPILIKKGQESKLTTEIELAVDVEAPVASGQVLGTARLMLDGKEAAVYPIRAMAAVERLTFWRAFSRLFRALTSTV